MVRLLPSAQLGWRCSAALPRAEYGSTQALCSLSLLEAPGVEHLADQRQRKECQSEPCQAQQQRLHVLEKRRRTAAAGVEPGPKEVTQYGCLSLLQWQDRSPLLVPGEN